MNLIDQINQANQRPQVKSFPNFRPGDSVAVHVKITEGNKTRTQIFQGICIAQKEKNSLNGHFRVRKLSAGNVGVERVFPYHCPNIVDVKLISKGVSRRAKHFYLRDRTGKSARIATDYDRAD